MYTPNQKRYERMVYSRCGASGLKLPKISFGLWRNFGGDSVTSVMTQMVETAFDLGITHFDLANNYGPPGGSAETNFGKIIKSMGHRDEMIISTKAGYYMWEGPYGEWGSRKSLIASLDRSLTRLGLDYVDVYYSHRPDPDTPLEETMGALAHAVKQGKALYVGLSNYGPVEFARASGILRSLGTPCVLHQPGYSMLNRTLEKGLLDAIEAENAGCVVYSPLHKGVLTDRYLHGMPADSSAAGGPGVFLRGEEEINEKLRLKLVKLSEIAKIKSMTMAQMALAWVLRDPRVTSAIIGASKPEQIIQCVSAANAPPFTEDELNAIDDILNESAFNR